MTSKIQKTIWHGEAQEGKILKLYKEILEDKDK
jgi:hypothetical protein